MSERLGFEGDYMGFTYNKKHSSELGIVRVSDGSRFNENLLPTMQDKTVQVPGGDGMYYFGSYYTQRQFNVSFAFDSLNEAEVAELKKHFGDKQIHDLIFDETPYKVWSAKVTGTATLKYIPFEEGTNGRIYKGEGTIQFTCYHPFARCVFSSQDIIDGISNNRTLEGWKEKLKETYPNINEWWGASRIAPNKNFGDIATPFTLTIQYDDTFNDPISGSFYGIEWAIPKEKMEYKEVVLDTRTGIAKNAAGEVLNRYFWGNLIKKIEPDYNTSAFSGEVAYNCYYI